jgi:putative ABC transport system permease protein
LIGEVFMVALSAIRANKLRSALTMLGIVIGVAAVITMVALGSGAQKAVQDQIERLGTDLLSVYAGQSFMRGVASEQRVSLTIDDATALEKVGGVLTNIVPELSGIRTTCRSTTTRWKRAGCSPAATMTLDGASR